MTIARQYAIFWLRQKKNASECGFKLIKISQVLLRGDLSGVKCVEIYVSIAQLKSTVTP